jgi:hypothetical protein
VEVSQYDLRWQIAFTGVTYLSSYGLPFSQRYRSLTDLDCYDFDQYITGSGIIKQQTHPWAFDGMDNYKTCDPITGGVFTPATLMWPLNFAQVSPPSEFVETGSRVVTVNSITLTR